MLSGIEGIHVSESNSYSGNLIVTRGQPVMECALDILTELVKHKTVILNAKGESIPTAVAVANVITENMLKGNSKILDISVDSENADGKYAFALVSIIKITISKTN